MSTNADMERFKEFELKDYVSGPRTKENVNNFFENDLMPHICAFLNVVDNKRSYIQINTEGVKPKEVDIFKKKLEDHIKDTFGIPLLYESIKMVDVDKGFQLIVTSRTELSSFKYNLYLPSNTSVENLSTLSIDTILPIINGWNIPENQSAEKEESESFVFDDIFPSPESNNIQFKHFKEENQQQQQQQQEQDNEKEPWQGLCKKIQSSKLSHYVSAFANDEGGRIYYGIEDKERKIKGETLKKEDQEKVRNKINDILIGKVYDKEEEKMKWGLSTEDDLKSWSQNTPGMPWDIQFIPVNENGTHIQDKFVIVITVHHFPNGVFSKSPQSYQWKKKPVFIEYTKWRKKMKNSYDWKENQIDRQVRKYSLKIINMVDKLVDSGESTKEVIKKLDESTQPDTPRITLSLQRGFAYYRKCNTSAVEKCLAEAREILFSEEPPVNRVVHELHYCSLKASFERSLGRLQESLLTTYECLEKTKRIIPGWETAIIWKTHGNNLAAAAGAASIETSSYEKKERFDGAVRAWCQAIHHARRAILTYGHIEKELQASIVNIIHMSQLYIALLHLGFTASGKVVEVPPRFTNDEVTNEVNNEVRNEVQNRIAAVSIGCPLSKYNNCLRLIVDFLVEPPNDELKKNQIREAAAKNPRIEPLATKVLEKP